MQSEKDDKQILWPSKNGPDRLKICLILKDEHKQK